VEGVGPGVRPTAARVREALFSMVGQDLEGARVLDAFGGTGLLGFEAWSRGARVVIVERDPRAARQIRANADALGAEVELHVGDVRVEVANLGRFTGVLVDPPYADDPAPIVARLAPAADGWLVLETDDRTPSPAGSPLVLDRRRSYGSTALSVYRSAEPDEPGRRSG
ncbi:MAG: RsmD family RNA methyltransferase, partial [Myxococcota bacterium]